MGKGNGLATLRRWRRAVSSALLPVFGLWALTAPACFAQVDSGALHSSPVVAHAQHAAAEPAHYGAAHDHSPATPPTEHCPHCPPVADADTSPSLCVGVTTAASVPQKNAALDSGAHVVAMRFAPLLSPQEPRPRHVTLPDTARYRLAVPLNIRHCVFLI
jgi:hypothetical protein